MADTTPQNKAERDANAEISFLEQKLLKSITPDEKRRILELFRKRQYLEAEGKLESFVPNPGFQDSFLKSQAKIRACFTGGGAGKTVSLIIDMLWNHLNLHPYRSTDNVQHTWLIVPGFEKAEDYWNEIKKWCPPSQLPQEDKMGSSHIKRFRWRNGSLTTIFSHEQDFSKLEGTNISGLYMDEAPPRALWISAFRGLRANPDYFVVIATTPYAEPWLFEEIYLPWLRKERDNIEVFTGSTYENKHISKDWIDDYARIMSEDERRVRIYGGFATVQGRVYNEFEKETHVIDAQEWPLDWPVWVCIDPHSRKPHTAVYLGVTPDANYVVVDELRVKGTIKDLADEIHKTNQKYPFLQAIYIDTKGVEADWTRNSAVDLLAKEGIYCSAVSRNEKELISGINRIKTLLRPDLETGEPQLKVMAPCVNTITEFEMYSWHDNKHPDQSGISEKPKKIHDDFLDPLRYLVSKNVANIVRYDSTADRDNSEISLFKRNAYKKKTNF